MYRSVGNRQVAQPAPIVTVDACGRLPAGEAALAEGGGVDLDEQSSVCRADDIDVAPREREGQERGGKRTDGYKHGRDEHPNRLGR
jgi:hypothetical protein